MPWRWIKYAYRSLKLWRLLDKLRKGKGGITETGNYGNGKGNGKGNGELRKRKGKRKGKPLGNNDRYLGPLIPNLVHCRCPGHFRNQA